MQGKFFELIGDFDALIDLFEGEAEEIFMQFRTQRRFPVDQPSNQQSHFFLADVQLVT